MRKPQKKTGKREALTLFPPDEHLKSVVELLQAHRLLVDDVTLAFNCFLQRCDGLVLACNGLLQRRNHLARVLNDSLESSVDLLHAHLLLADHCTLGVKCFLQRHNRLILACDGLLQRRNLLTTVFNGQLQSIVDLL